MTGRLPSSWPAWARETTRLVLIGAVMGVVGYLFGKWLAEAYPDLGPLTLPRWADLLAFFLAFILVFASVWTAAISLNARALGKVLKLEGPAGPTETRDSRIQAAVLGLSGVIMALPPILMAIGADPLFAIGLLLVLLALHTALNIRVYRSADEFLRRTVMEAGVVTFWAGQGVLFLWAAAERLSLAPALTAWDIYVVMMGAYLVGSMIVTVRRGLA